MGNAVFALVVIFRGHCLGYHTFLTTALDNPLFRWKISHKPPGFEGLKFNNLIVSSLARNAMDIPTFSVIFL